MTSEHSPLDIDWLRDFTVLAETGNFSRAADARAIAQPAFSRHIRALEDWVGVPLVDRSAHPVELTAGGRQFLPQVQALLAHLEAARIKAKVAHDQASASLRFAATHALSLTFFPAWLSRLEVHHRLGQVQTLSDTYQGCEDLMQQRRVQFVLCYGHAGVPCKLDDYPMQVLGQEGLLPVSCPDAQGQPLFDLQSVRPLPLLDYGEASALGRILRATQKGLHAGSTAGAAGRQTSVVFSAHNAFLLKAMALEGRGLAWLPRSLIEAELATGRLVLAGDAAWQVAMDIRLYRQKFDMSEMAEAIWAWVNPTVK